MNVKSHAKSMDRIVGAGRRSESRKMLTDKASTVEGGLEDLLRMISYGMNWRKYGYSSFRITEDMFCSVMLTDMGRVPMAEIKPPFDTFAISIPAGYWETADGPVDLVTVIMTAVDYETAEPEVIREGLDSLKLMPDSYKDEIASNAEKHRGKFSMMVELHGDESLPTIYSKSKPYGPEVTIGEFLKKERRTRGLCEMESDALEKAKTLVLGLCLYLSERGETWKPRPVSKNNPTWRVVKLNETVVGREVVIDRRLKEAVRQGRGEPIRKIATRFIVRGHWRNQACGVGGKSRRLTWIAPHWKGPEGAPKSQRMYAV